MTSLFPPSVDETPGRIDRVPSRITGECLAYFTPDPLAEVLARCHLPRETTLHAERATRLLLARAASQRRDAMFDRRMADALFELPSMPLQGLDGAALIALARTILPDAALRSEIVFSGARVASQGHVFADPAFIAERLQQLGNGVDTTPGDLHGTVLAACVAFNALHLHPFRDGNGRWARLLTALACHRHGAPVSGLIHACLLTRGTRVLADRHWPRARDLGLRDYLTRCIAFESGVLQALDEASADFETLCEALARLIRARSRHSRIVHTLLRDACIAGPVLKQAAECSQRVFDGWCAHVAGLKLPGLDLAPQGLRIDRMLAMVDRHLEAQVHAHFGE